MTAREQLLGLGAARGHGASAVVQFLLVLRRAKPFPAERVDQSRMLLQALLQRALLRMRLATATGGQLAIVLQVVDVVDIVVVVVDDIVVDGVDVNVGRQHHGYTTACHDISMPALGQLLVRETAERELGRACTAGHGRVHGLAVFGADAEHGAHGGRSCR